jgi:hypothetical protein
MHIVQFGNSTTFFCDLAPRLPATVCINRIRRNPPTKILLHDVGWRDDFLADGQQE